MSFEEITEGPGLETLAAVIAGSPIIVAAALRIAPLPAGFDDVDIAILRWIAADSRRLGRSVLRH